MPISLKKYGASDFYIKNLNSFILLAHAFTGCDTTSRLYNIGKEKILKSAVLRKACEEAAVVFYSPVSSKNEIALAGQMLLLALYNRKNVATLDDLRSKIFMEKVDGINVIKPESLPPTTEAMTHHSYRVYHQVQTWLGNAFPAEDCSWTVRKFVKILFSQTSPQHLIIF